MADSLDYAKESRTGVVRHGPYPELTWTAVIVGWFLGAIITLSIGYAALILGFSIEGSELAAILGWGILRGILRRNSIIENNINQTIASAVNGASAGMMFSVPALFILAHNDPARFGHASEFSYVLMVLASITGGILGLAFVIPLRKQMIDFNRLAYPGGVAVATILKSPGAGLRKALLLIIAALVSGGFYLFCILNPSHFETLGAHPQGPLGEWLGTPAYLNLTFFLSLMTVGVGFISGKGGLVFGYGGFICYFLLAPLLLHFGSDHVKELIDPVAAAHADGVTLSAQETKAAVDAVPNLLREELFQPTGIGMLIGAAVGGIIAAFPLIRSAVRSMRDAHKENVAGTSASDEMPISLLALAIGGGTVALIAIAEFSTEDMVLWRAAAMAVLGTIWIWIAGVIVSECMGRTNWSPLSGMTLIAVTILILVASKFNGLSDASSVISAVMCGAAICVAIAQAGDMMLDLKSGYLVGARPRIQQYAQYIGMWLGPILVMFLIWSLDNAYKLGSDHLPAPQGKALASVLKGILGGDVPGWRYTAGAGLGALLAFSGLGGVGVMIGLGFYMPFDIVLTYTVGVLIRIMVNKTAGSRFAHEVGIPIAAGLIVGEALVGVGNAFVYIGSSFTQP